MTPTQPAATPDRALTAERYTQIEAYSRAKSDAWQEEPAKEMIRDLLADIAQDSDLIAALSAQLEEWQGLILQLTEALAAERQQTSRLARIEAAAREFVNVEPYTAIHEDADPYCVYCGATWDDHAEVQRHNELCRFAHLRAALAPATPTERGGDHDG